MSHEHTQEYGRNLNGTMQRAMGRGGRDGIVREALERIDGAPAPEVGTMQAAMGRESQVRAAYEVIRGYLDEHGLQNTREWAARLANRENARVAETA